MGFYFHLFLYFTGFIYIDYKALKIVIKFVKTPPILKNTQRAAN